VREVQKRKKERMRERNKEREKEALFSQRGKHIIASSQEREMTKYFLCGRRRRTQPADSNQGQEEPNIGYRLTL
jgi:hypothetical protein